jgi:hypothetical protein
MSFRKCDNRADPNYRKKLNSEYTIIPVAHTKLLPQQGLMGCCGEITGECYTFSFEHKANSADSGLFSVGRHCALDFLALTNTSAPPCFNPLTAASTGRGGKGSASSPMPSMCALNLEAYQAINLLTLEWGPPKAPLRSILNAIVSAPNSPLSDSNIIYLNNIIGKDRQGRTLTGIISALKILHPQFRTFTFPLIGSLLIKASRTSKF